MIKIDVHPNCFRCDNCEEIKHKKNYQIFQDDTGKQINFCEECANDLEYYLKEFGDNSLQD